MCTIGKKYNKSNAQVILRWLYQNHIIAIPKSVHEDRIKQNYAIHDFSLTQEDLQKIQTMDKEIPLILNITDLAEVYRLHGITFEQ